MLIQLKIVLCMCFLISCLFTSSTTIADAGEFKLVGSITNSGKTLETSPHYNYRLIFSQDGSRLLRVGLKVVEENDLPSKYYAELKVWNTEHNFRPINNTEKYLNSDQDMYQLHLMEARFSGNNQVIAFAQPALNENFVWDYENSNETKDVCTSLMGSDLLAVSDSGKLFAVTTDDDWQFVCRTDFHIDEDPPVIFIIGDKPFDDQQVKDIKSLGSDINVSGFIGDKILMTYYLPSKSSPSNKQIEEFTKKYPLVELLPRKNLEPAIVDVPMSGKHFSPFVQGPSQRAIKVTSGFFGDESYQYKGYIFNKIGCKHLGNSKYINKLHNSDEVRLIKGGVTEISEDGSTMLTCEGHDLHLYKKSR